MPDTTTIKELTFPEICPDFSVDSEAYANFLNTCCNDKNTDYAVFSFPVPWDDLLERLNLFSAKNEFQYYWEKPSESICIAAGGTLLKILKSGDQRFKDTHQTIETINKHTAYFSTSGNQHPPLHFLGGFSFFNENPGKNWSGFGSASFVLPKRTAVKRDGSTTISITISLKEKSSPKRIHKKVCEELNRFKKKKSFRPIQNGTLNGNSLPIKSSSTTHADKEWTALVNEAKQHIMDKELDKVVLARQIKVSKLPSCTPTHMLKRMRYQYPQCCSFLIKMDNSPAFIGCSPEQLISFTGDTIHTEALAGSIARGTDDKEDWDNRNTLLNSSKNNIEHQYVVQSIEQDLAPFIDSLSRKEKPIIKKLANVQHLYTPIRAEKKAGVNPLQILGRLHPTPAVGGYPAKEAANFIKQKESINRGWFASPVGWINTEGSGEFTVAIRSGLVNKTSALLFAGCGIVADSDAETEWQETTLKFMPMLSALNHD